MSLLLCRPCICLSLKHDWSLQPSCLLALTWAFLQLQRKPCLADFLFPALLQSHRQLCRVPLHGDRLESRLWSAKDVCSWILPPHAPPASQTPLPPRRLPRLDSPPVPWPQAHLDQHVPLGAPARGGGHPTRLYGCREHPGELKSNKNA